MRKLFSQRNRYLATWLTLGFVVSSYYNACGQVTFKQTQSSLLEQMKSASVIVINKDEMFTNSDQVELGLNSNFAEEMYVTNVADCSSGGQWEPFSQTRPWLLGSKNLETSVYVKYRNQSESLITDCISDSIIHDDEDPSVVLQMPVMATNVPAPVVNFVAGDRLSGLDKMFCEWPGQAVQDCRFATSNGNLPENRYLVKISASDKAGNVSDPILQDLIVDRTPPVITILNSPPVLGNSQNVQYSFNVADVLSGVAKIECAFDNKASYAVCASPHSAANLAMGAHKFHIRATDVAGNVSEVEHAFTIDASAPTVTITKGPADYSKDQNAAFEFVGVDAGVAISLFECRLDGGAYASCSSPKLYAGLADGLHTFDVIGIDAAGNRSAPASRSWYVDTKAPTIAFTLEPDALTSKTTVEYHYAVSDVGSGVDKVQCSVDGGAYADCLADKSVLANLAAGIHTFRVRGIDKAGNIGESALKSFEVDNTLPTIRFTKVPGPWIKDQNFTFEFLAEDAKGIQTVECKLGAAAFVSCASLTSHAVAGLAEGSHRFSIRAKDRAGNQSVDVYTDFGVDLTLPVIAFLQEPPAAVIAGSAVSLNFSVSDVLSGVKGATCTLNGAATVCASGQAKNLGALAAGDYTFIVNGEDNAGNIATVTRMIRVTAPVLKNQVVDVKGSNKVDILVVIDNSGSMAAEQANMSQRFNNFLDKVKTLDYQIGIITTDVSSNANLKDGRLVPLKVPAGVNFPAGQYVLTSATSQATAQAVFGATVQMGTSGSGAEQGFRASYRAVERAFDGLAVSAPNAMLFRADAALAILVVSDAYDTSGTTGDMLKDLIAQKWAQKAFVFHSIVVPESIYTNPNGTAIAGDPCRNYRESVRFDGRNYHSLSTMTGGVKGTVCSEDFSGQLADMGKVTVELVNSVTLQCQPVDSNADGVVNMADVQVTTAAGQAVTGFRIEGTKLTFDQALPLGTNQVQYYCAQ